ncbi:MAG: zf-HC2 domain-containing protein [Clostridia bacterium]|nr:zf-HC2 domain-containing protein [Clostridia bacterium]
MKTECSIVRDLLPLYIENLVSPETAGYVEEHLKICPDCRAEMDGLREGDVPVTTEDKTDGAKPFEKVMKRLNRRFYMLAYFLIIFFVFLGFSWTGGENLLYNSVVMPAVGVFGYCVFGWKAVFKVPALLLLTDLLVYCFRMVEIGFADALVWTFVYSLFAIVGIIIAFLLHFAFRKDDVK